jgi:hypothetical protein
VRRSYRNRRPVPFQPTLDLTAPTACLTCGRDLVPVVRGGLLDLSALTALGLEEFNRTMRCWAGKCRGTP